MYTKVYDFSDMCNAYEYRLGDFASFGDYRKRLAKNAKKAGIGAIIAGSILGGGGAAYKYFNNKVNSVPPSQQNTVTEDMLRNSHPVSRDGKYSLKEDLEDEDAIFDSRYLYGDNFRSASLSTENAPVVIGGVSKGVPGDLKNGIIEDANSISRVGSKSDKENIEKIIDLVHRGNNKF